MKIDLIKENPRNPRKITDDAFEKLVKSIKDFPEMLEARPLVIDMDNVVIGGNMRLKALKSAGVDDVPVKQVDWSEDKKKEFVIKDNLAYGIWDYEILGADYEAEDLEDWGLKIDVGGGDGYEDGVSGSLADDFLIPPFSIFDTKQGYWQDRKRAWTGFIGYSGDGRADDLIGEGLKKLARKTGAENLTGTSIFDPVLTEISYKWWNIPNGKILDPFAGGIVRGAVAGRLGYEYTGIDLSDSQIKANYDKLTELGLAGVNYILGNSLNLDELIKEKEFDFVFSCPPYYDLEIYTENKEDISNLESYEGFISQYREIIKKSVSKLKEDRFAVFVVGDIRDKTGAYRGFVADTIQAFKDAGMVHYNDIILANAIATASLRARNLFSNRKVVKIHQNVLVFYKGNIKNIKNNFSQDIDFSNLKEDETDF